VIQICWLCSLGTAQFVQSNIIVHQISPAIKGKCNQTIGIKSGCQPLEYKNTDSFLIAQTAYNPQARTIGFDLSRPQASLTSIGR